MKTILVTLAVAAVFYLWAVAPLLAKIASLPVVIR